VDFLVVTPAALLKNTQAIRKARQKFQSVRLVLPDFVHASISGGALCDPTDYAPAPTSGDTNGSVTSAARRPRGAALAEVGLEAGAHLEVLVEMSDEPLLQWWPATVHAPVAGLSATAHPLTYHPLPARGYDEPTESRARFECASDGSERPPDADGQLYDLEEGVWRPWRKEASSAVACANASTAVLRPPATLPPPEAAGAQTAIRSLAATDLAAALCEMRKRRRRARRARFSCFKRMSAARAFARGVAIRFGALR
jgi:hypothetical protein